MTSPHVDLAPAADEFLRDVLAGLGRPQKAIPCKYFYDEEGSRLFEAITELKEYYPTRTEVAILKEHVADMAELLGPHCLLIEFGSGNSTKTEVLLNLLVDPAGYVPIEISREHLLESVSRVRAAHPDLEILPVVADYTGEIELPESKVPAERRVAFFPGSTIGNFGPGDATDFLKMKAELVGPGGGLLIGVDLRKDPATLERAYDDVTGVTAAFNRNLLVRANRELNADFRPEAFEHRAVWNEEAGRVEMYLVSLGDQKVRVGEKEFAFEDGETIWTESSYKYTSEEFRRLAELAGFRQECVWTDADELFSVQYHSVA